MTTHSLMPRAALLLLALSQIWLLYRLETLRPATDISARSDHELAAVASSVSPSVSPDNTMALMPDFADDAAPIDHASAESEATKALLRIDQRLARLEQQLARVGAGQSNMPAATAALTAQEQVAADQRLASLLPSGPVSQRELAQFHRDLHQAPPEQRLALATALARAINDGRIQPSPH